MAGVKSKYMVLLQGRLKSQQNQAQLGRHACGIHLHQTIFTCSYAVVYANRLPIAGNSNFGFISVISARYD
jgi:hypothetical protein